MMRIIRILFLTLLVICFSCEDKGWFVNCNDCNTTEPVNTQLVVRLTANDSVVTVRVYEGEIGDSVIYVFAKIWDDKYYPSVSLNKKYTVSATYRINNKTYVAFDSVTPRIKYTKDECDEACYFVYNRKVDLRLKYTAN